MSSSQATSAAPSPAVSRHACLLLLLAEPLGGAVGTPVDILLCSREGAQVFLIGRRMRTRKGRGPFHALLGGAEICYPSLHHAELFVPSRQGFRSLARCQLRQVPLGHCMRGTQCREGRRHAGASTTNMRQQQTQTLWPGAVRACAAPSS